MPNELTELKQIWLRADRELHEPNCWRWHHKCAIARLIATIEQLQQTTQPKPTKTKTTKRNPTTPKTTKNKNPK